MVKKLYSVEGMSKKLSLKGELPSTKKLYKNFMLMAWPAMVNPFL